MAIVEKPHDEEAENALLGSCLIDPEQAVRWMDALEPSDFYIVKHAELWRVIQGLARKGLPIDWIGVKATLGDEKFRDYGDEAWLSELTDIPSALNADSYAAIVRTQSERRRIIRACEESARAAFDQRMSLEQVRSVVLSETGKALGTAVRGARHQREVIRDIVEWLERIERGEVEPHGMGTGLTDLDKLTDGLFPAEVTILAGRPGMGKSALAAEIGDAIARMGKRKVLVFSLEMRDTIWTGRTLSSVAGVDARKLIRIGGLDSEEWGRMASAIVNVSNATLYIDDRRGLTDTDIRTQARQLAADLGGLDLIVVDHLTLVRSARRFESYRKEVGWTVLTCREMAKELNCHVLLAAQLNRKVEDRSDKHPTLSDLAESGDIEQHADNVWTLYRDEYYNPDSERKGIAEVWALKGRNGMTGHVDVAYDPVRQRFANLARLQL